jgi:hypothetical protein
LLLLNAQEKLLFQMEGGITMGGGKWGKEEESNHNGLICSISVAGL